MSAKVLIITLLAGLTVSQCTIGCLKCNALNQCLLCDISNSYYLSGNTCLLSTQTNCNIIGLTGACVQCNTNFYLDVNSQKCLALPTTVQIANCGFYSPNQVCLSCTGNFFLQNGRCVAVNATIANCQLYNANQGCAVCASGFVVNTANSACVALPSNANCLFYTYLGCRACNPGYVANPNLYFTNFANANYVNALYFPNAVARTYDWIGLSQCQAVVVLNCLTYSAFDVCTNCAAGFYLDKGNCVAYPLPIIFGCAAYSNLVTCSACQAGYYLSSNTCLANTVILNCITYSGAASTTTCLGCSANYYLQGNQCVNRTISLNIANCATVSINSDTCATCAIGFILTSDGRACLIAIANCATYAAGSNAQSSTLQCSLCNNGFYLTNSGSATVCTSGTIQFCQTYQVNANTCTKCNNGYYLQNSQTCVQHTTISNCATYDPTRANYCSVCAPGYYNFALTTVCVPVNTITNCVAYNAEGTLCSKCADGYYVNGGSCTLIPSTYANCAVFSAPQCSLCKPGYMINSLPTVGTCTLPLDYVQAATNSPCGAMTVIAADKTPWWVGTTSSTQAVLTCRVCNDYMYGYAPKQPEAICVNNNQLSLYSGYSAVTNCIRYGLNYATSPAIVCMQCASGYYISGYGKDAWLSTGLTCTSTCSLASGQTSPSIIPDDMLGWVNICIAYSATAGDGVGSLALGNCFREGRYRLNGNANAALADPDARLLADDYRCWAAYPASGSSLVNALIYDAGMAAVNTNVYFYETPSATAQVNAAYTYVGYSNTVDLNSVVPNVFNYHGLLQGSYYAAAVGGAALGAANSPFIRPKRATATDVDFTAGTNIYASSITNCDIFAKYVVTTTGTAYLTAATKYTAVPQTVLYSCFRCAFGYGLTFSSGTTVASTFGFPTCSQMTSCASSSTVYGGLPMHLNSMLSCHVCSQSNGASTFPTVHFEYMAVAAQGGWIGSDPANGFGTPVSGNTIVNEASGFKCLAAPSSVATTDADPPVLASVTNCAVFGKATGLTAASNAGAAATTKATYTICMACAANYWPTYLGATFDAAAAVVGAGLLPSYAVTKCTASENCDASVITQFNFCGRCRTDQDNLLAPIFFAYHDFTLSNCFRAATRNCLILSTTGFLVNHSTGNTCDICKAGFFKNADNVCEQYKVPNQAINNGVFTNAYVSSSVWTGTTPTDYTGITDDTKFVRAHYLLSYKQLQYGVNACSSGYTLAPANIWAPTVCVWSSHVYNNTGNFPASSAYINNCVRYLVEKSNSKYICGGCTTGFIPTTDGLKCVSSSAIPNCLVTQNSPNEGLCATCLDNFYNINGICSSTTIANCAKYVNNPTSFALQGGLQCSLCIEGFVLSTDSQSCTAGQIRNCNTYNQGKPLECVTCAAGYVQMTLNTVTYCYPIPASLNCALLQDTSPNSGANWGTISCAQCQNTATQVYGIRGWAALARTTEPQTMCMPFTAIANCAAYNQDNAVIKSNTFGCATCSPGFWYSASNYTCAPRFNTPAQCTTYNPTADVCTACGSGSFLSADGRQCVVFPNGIFQCRLYSAANTCTQCNAGYYLSSNVCVASTIINNCFTYAANFTCAACNAGFYLNNATSCITASAANCLTYASLTACASCGAGYGLQTTNGVTSCVLVNLANCANATTIAPFTCNVCNQGFYPGANGQCVTVSSTIPNCLTYDTATTCSRCTSDSVLTVARTSCNQTAFAGLIDANCQQNFIQGSPVCTQCAAGTYFVNGTCTSCSNNTYAGGCFSCDPLNNNACLLCRPTFYMNSAGSCVANNPTPTPTPTPTPNGTSSAKAKAAGVALALATIVYWA